MEVYQGGQKILPSLFRLGVSDKGRNSVEDCGDCKAQTVLLADTLSLRVARSGTKRPASARLGAKNRRLPKVCQQNCLCFAIRVTFMSEFRFG